MKNYVIPILLVLGLGLFYITGLKESQETKSTNQGHRLVKKKRPPINHELQGLTGPRKFFNYHQSLKTKQGDLGPRYTTNYRQEELVKARGKHSSINYKNLNWVERGPGNVSGRTRSLYVDPRDNSHSTWLAGSVGGGVWRTEDAGDTWSNLTPDLASLSTSSIACSNANPDIIYVGTGEGIPGSGPRVGSGIFKSIDNGTSFEGLTFTQNNEKIGAVTRLVISEVDPNVVYASTIRSVYDFEVTPNGGRPRTGSYIFKTIDGGNTWDEIFMTEDNYVQQVVIDSENEQNIYGKANGLGIFKSTNGGVDWERTFDAASKGILRIELAIAPTDNKVVYAACEGDNTVSVLNKSVDVGLTWKKVEGQNLPLNSWLGGQGFYDNTLAVQPFDSDIVLLGGQLQLLEVNTNAGTTQNDELIFSQSIPLVPDLSDAFEIAETRANEFGATTTLSESDLEGISILVNQGTTNAFRYNVSFQYVDQISIPIRAVNDQGEDLAITVFDLNSNGEWDYEEGALTEPLVIYKYPTDELSNSITAGNLFGQAMYIFAPTFIQVYDLTDLPEATLSLQFISTESLLGEVKPIADFVGDFRNEFPDVGRNGIHPDHHDLKLIPIDETTGSCYILGANDGGVAFSKDNGLSFRQTGVYSPFAEDVPVNPMKGYNTTQFYGVDKMNGSDRYIGGSQDNSVWLSPEDPSETSDWVLAPSFDGMETAWHYLNPDLILQTSQNNEIWKSIDRGISWRQLELPSSTGPFVTRLTNSKQEPDFVCMVSAEGILKSYDFGDTWELVPLPVVVDNAAYSIPTEISLSSPRVVWTGNSFDNLAVSEDAANNFGRVNEYDEAALGPITSINTHPVNPRKAYITYSFANAPKILMTDNLGESWTDISGFTTHNTPESNNGFPDVPTTSLLVMPYDTTILWAGTEIGIFESTDSGASWHYADNGLPALSIWEMKIVNDEVIIASHGRGIWSVGLPELQNYEPIPSTRFPKLNIDYTFANRIEGNIELLSAFDSTKLDLLVMDGTRETILFNGENTTPKTDVFAYTLDLQIDEVEVATLLLYAYRDGLEYVATIDVLFYNVEDNPVANYNNNFESGTSSFAKLGFTESFLSELNTTGLQSIHPYERQVNYFSVMRQPIIVENTSEPLMYDEIALVEPGVIPDPTGEQIFDFVSVSATSDYGRTWTELAKYDANEQTEWFNSFANTVITPDLVFPKMIDVGQSFEIGDTLYFRFDLVTDFSVEGWGWYVDNINYGMPLNTNEVQSPIAELVLSPNPAIDQATLNILLEESTLANYSIYNLQGQLLKKSNLGRLFAGDHSIPISLNELNAGTYILNVGSGNTSKTIKFSKI